MAIQYDPASDPNWEGGAEAPNSFAQQQETQLGRANTRYNERQSNVYEPSVNDVELHSVLAQLERTTNPLLRERLESQAMLLASGGVAKEQRSSRRRGFTEVQLSDPNEVGGRQSPMATVYGQMQAHYGSELEDTLQWAREELDPETAATLNESLISDDINVARKAFEVLQSLRLNGLTSLPTRNK